MERHLARVRFLSTRFLELQGLRVACAGATIALVFGTYLMVAPPTDTGGLIAVAVSFVAMIPGQLWAHRYYARTFGRQMRTPRNQLPTAVCLVIGYVIAAYLDRRFPEIPAGGPTAAMAVQISVLVAIRDWPWRAYYLSLAAAVAGAFSATIVGVDVIDRGMTLSVTWLVTGVSMVGVGLLDHALLVRLMQQARNPETIKASS